MSVTNKLFSDDYKDIEDLVNTNKLLKSQIELQDKDKLVALEAMLCNVAHQWRQPLSVITTCASGLLYLSKEGHEIDKESLEESLVNIIQTSKYLSETIDTFSNSIKSKKDFQPINIYNALKRAIQISITNLKQNSINIEFNYKIDENLTLDLRLGEIEQVIINLINNSKDAFLDRNIQNPWIKIDSITKDNYLIITIEDNAGGISEEIISKIYAPYFTTKHESVGTGLGLSMAYSIISNSMNGEIKAVNTVNGALFLINIPFENQKVSKKDKS